MLVHIKLKKSSNWAAWSNQNLGREVVATMGPLNDLDPASRVVYHVNVADNPGLDVSPDMVSGFVELTDADIN